MLDNGWIKLDRKILTWRWYQEPNTKAVFLHLLLTANYEDRDYKSITIHRGEALITQSDIAKSLGLTRQEVRTALNHLNSTKEITTTKRGKYTVISIPNYDYYQTYQPNNQPTANQQLTNSQPTANQQYKRNKEYKESNNNIYRACGKVENSKSVENSLEDYNGVWLTVDQYRALESLCGTEMLSYIDRVGEWLLKNPKPKEAHYSIFKKFVENDQ